MEGVVNILPEKVRPLLELHEVIAIADESSGQVGHVREIDLL